MNHFPNNEQEVNDNDVNILIDADWTTPLDRDYCYGKRGRTWQNWEGTRVFRELVKECAPVYHNGNTRIRNQIVQHMIQVMRDDGRRFFKLEEGDVIDYWVNVTEDQRELKSMVKTRVRDACKRLNRRPILPAMN